MRWYLGEKSGGQLQLKALLLAQVTLQVLAHRQRPAFHEDEQGSHRTGKAVLQRSRHRQVGNSAEQTKPCYQQRPCHAVSRVAVAVLVWKGSQVCVRNDVAERLRRFTSAPEVLTGGLQLEVVAGQRGLHHGVDAEAVLHDVPHLVQVRIAQPQAVLPLLRRQTQRHLRRQQSKLPFRVGECAFAAAGVNTQIAMQVCCQRECSAARNSGGCCCGESVAEYMERKRVRDITVTRCQK